MSDEAELIRRGMDTKLADVRTAMAVRVQTYDFATRTVDVTPLVLEVTETDDGDITEALPVIPSVPVAFPRAGGFFITFPIVPGDTGQIVICDRSIDQWRTRGSQSYTPSYGYAVDPLDKRQHHASAAVFYPGLSDSLNPILDAHPTDMVIGKDGGSSIHITPLGEVKLGFAPTDFVALAALVLTELGNIKTWADLHMHTSAAAGVQTTTPTSAPGVPNPMPTPSSVAATKVKAD
jgi:hypothetical protein